MLLLLAACGSVPEPQPAPEQETAPIAERQVPEPAVVESVDAETDLPFESAAPPNPVDYNGQFYEEAVAAMKQGETELAIELLVHVSSEAPGKPYVFTNLGLAYFGLQKSELAEQAFRQAIERNRRDAVAHNHLGILQRQKGEFEAARDSYRRAIDADRDYAPAYLNLGILFDIYLQQIDVALKHYQRYQSLIGEEDAQVAGWIVDIERRLKSSSASSKG